LNDLFVILVSLTKRLKFKFFNFLLRNLAGLLVVLVDFPPGPANDKSGICFDKSEKVKPLLIELKSQNFVFKNVFNLKKVNLFIVYKLK